MFCWTARLVVNTLLHFPLPDSGDSNTLLFVSGLIQYLTLTEFNKLGVVWNGQDLLLMMSIEILKLMHPGLRN